MINETAILQYKIELGANGMKDGAFSSLSASEKLDRLKNYRLAWDGLQWSEDKTVEMTMGQIWELYGGVLAQARPGKEVLQFRQLSSRYRSIEEKTWTVDVSKFAVRDFTMDSSQDLLVIAEKPRLM